MSIKVDLFSAVIGGIVGAVVIAILAILGFEKPWR